MLILEFFFKFIFDQCIFPPKKLLLRKKWRGAKRFSVKIWRFFDVLRLKIVEIISTILRRKNSKMLITLAVGLLDTYKHAQTLSLVLKVLYRDFEGIRRTQNVSTTPFQ